MKKVYFIIVALLAGLNIYGQTDCRATCTSPGLTIEAYIKPFSAPVAFPLATNNDIQLIVVFSLPANGATNTSMAPMPVSVSTPLGPGSPALTTLFVFNDRYNYSYQYITQNAPTQAEWAINSPHLVMSLTFGTNANGILPRLDNLLSGGGPGGANYFFFQLNNVQRSDTEGDPFYNGSEGTYGNGDQWVEALNPLPIKLISFSAEKSGEKSALLIWSTTSESNSSYFGIERSYDKVSWKTVGQVKAAGNSQIVLNYNFLDKDVYNGTASNLTVYYRLKMTDLDASFEYSPIESVNFGKRDALASTHDFKVYPNPASEGIHVEWDANQTDQPTSLEFYDVSGKLIYTENVEDQTSEHYVDFTKTNIQAGLSLMRVMSGDKAIEYKQIVVGQNH